MDLEVASQESFEGPIEHLLHALETKLDAVATKVMEHARDLGKHEEPTTSALAQAIRSELDRYPIDVPGLKLVVSADEFTKKQESKSGADLYIGLVRLDQHFTTSKGMLVQAKNLEALETAEGRRTLRNQSARMRRRLPEDSYVWVFTEGKVLCTKAPKSSDPHLRDLPYKHQSIGNMIAQGLRCQQGDDTKGPLLGASPVRGLRSRIEELSVPRGISFTVEPD